MLKRHDDPKNVECCRLPGGLRCRLSSHVVPSIERRAEGATDKSFRTRRLGRRIVGTRCGEGAPYGAHGGKTCPQARGSDPADRGRSPS